MGKLRHFAISVEDPDKAAKFYEQVFGMQRVGENDHAGAQGVYVSDGVVNLALLRYKTDVAAGEDRGKDYFGVHHLGFVVDDVDEVKKRIEDNGGSYLMGEKAKTGGFFEMKFKDPNGVIFDINDTGWRLKKEGD